MVENNRREMPVRIIFYCWIFISGIAQSVNAEEDAACWPMIGCIEKTSEYIGTSSATDFHLCIDAPCPSLTPPSLTPSGGKALWVCLIDDYELLNPSFELEFELEVDANDMLDKDSVGRALGFKNGEELYCKRGPSRQDPFGGGAKHPIDTECSTSVENLSFHSKHGWGSIEKNYIRHLRYSFQCTQAASD